MPVRNKVGRPSKGAVRLDPWGNRLPSGVSWRPGSADGLYVAWLGSGPTRTYLASRAASASQPERRRRIGELSALLREAVR